MDVLQSCCCCLLRPSELHLRTPYTGIEKTEIYSDMLEECFNINLAVDNDECGICEACVGRLRDASDFKLQVQRSQAELRERLERAQNVKEEEDESKIKMEAYDRADASDGCILSDESRVKDEMSDNDAESSHGGDQIELILIKSEPISTKRRKKERSTTPSSESETETTATEQNDQQSDKDLKMKSKVKYIATYENFLKWKLENNVSSFAENVLLAYFTELGSKYRAASLLSYYSMLKYMLRVKKGVNIGKYKKLKDLLKKKSEGYVPKKPRIFTGEDVERFIDEAPDDVYLDRKVALIFGVAGSIGGQELCNIKLEDIEDRGDTLLVTVNENLPRMFVLSGAYCKVVKKYLSLRSSKATSTRFFQQYRNGKCAAQVVGKNKLGSMPKEIAEFLKLEEPGAYTGHSFRRSSALGSKEGKRLWARYRGRL